MTVVSSPATTDADNTGRLVRECRHDMIEQIARQMHCSLQDRYLVSLEGMRSSASFWWEVGYMVDAWLMFRTVFGAQDVYRLLSWVRLLDNWRRTPGLEARAMDHKSRFVRLMNSGNRVEAGRMAYNMYDVPALYHTLRQRADRLENDLTGMPEAEKTPDLVVRLDRGSRRLPGRRPHPLVPLPTACVNHVAIFGPEPQSHAGTCSRESAVPAASAADTIPAEV